MLVRARIPSPRQTRDGVNPGQRRHQRVGVVAQLDRAAIAGQLVAVHLRGAADCRQGNEQRPQRQRRQDRARRDGRQRRYEQDADDNLRDAEHAQAHHPRTMEIFEVRHFVREDGDEFVEAQTIDERARDHDIGPADRRQRHRVRHHHPGRSDDPHTRRPRQIRLRHDGAERRHQLLARVRGGDRRRAPEPQQDADMLPLPEREQRGEHCRDGPTHRVGAGGPDDQRRGQDDDGEAWKGEGGAQEEIQIERKRPALPQHDAPQPIRQPSPRQHHQRHRPDRLPGPQADEQSETGREADDDPAARREQPVRQRRILEIGEQHAIAPGVHDRRRKRHQCCEDYVGRNRHEEQENVHAHHPLRRRPPHTIVARHLPILRPPHPRPAKPVHRDTRHQHPTNRPATPHSRPTDADRRATDLARTSPRRSTITKGTFRESLCYHRRSRRAARPARASPQTVSAAAPPLPTWARSSIGRAADS